MAGPTPHIECLPVGDFAALGTTWVALEARAMPSFFQSWSWVGCLAEERYPDPVLLRATLDGQVMGLALCNRRRGRLCLAESGETTLDAPFVEHNAPLVARDAPPGLMSLMLQVGWQARGIRRLVLSGVAPALARGAGGIALRQEIRPAPYVDLAALRTAGGNYLSALSANTRYQLRRSAKHYGGAEALEVTCAADERQALAWLEALIVLHEATWQSRGKSGAFATPYLRRFHTALIQRGLQRGEVELLRIATGGHVLGYLYNFRRSDRVLAYQSGFDYGAALPHGKPGLTCHQLAIERALASGADAYDFLAGDDRYKRSLMTASQVMIWVELVSNGSLLGLLAQGRQLYHTLFNRPAGRACDCSSKT